MAPRPSLTPEQRKGYCGKKIPTFCLNVMVQRQAVNMTQEELASKCGTTRQRISEIEGGKLPRDENRIIAIADALNVSLDWLFGRKGSPNTGTSNTNDYSK